MFEVKAKAKARQHRGQGQGHGFLSSRCPRGRGQSSRTPSLVLGYRSRTLTLNHNPITDPNPKINKKRHLNEIKHRVICKSRFPRTGWVYKRPITGTGKETHGYSSLLVVLVCSGHCKTYRDIGSTRSYQTTPELLA